MWYVSSLGMRGCYCFAHTMMISTCMTFISSGYYLAQFVMYALYDFTFAYVLWSKLCHVIIHKHYFYIIFFVYKLYPFIEPQAYYFFIYHISLKYLQYFVQFEFFINKVRPQYVLLHDLYFEHVYIHMYIFKMYVCIVRYKICIFEIYFWRRHWASLYICSEVLRPILYLLMYSWIKSCYEL